MGKNDKIKLAVAIIMLVAAGGIVYWFMFRDPTPPTAAQTVQPSPATPIEQMPPADARPSGGGARRAVNVPG